MAILPESIQQDIQSSLPILPNNGNPAGAYNMPQAEAVQEQQPAPDPYAWLKPSPYMEQVRSFLSMQDEMIERALFAAQHPQDKQLYNPVVREGEFHIQPLDDNGMTIDLEGQPITYPLPSPHKEVPQYVPVLPEGR